MRKLGINEIDWSAFPYRIFAGNTAKLFQFLSIGWGLLFLTLLFCVIFDNDQPSLRTDAVALIVLFATLVGFILFTHHWRQILALQKLNLPFLAIGEIGIIQQHGTAYQFIAWNEVQSAEPINNPYINTHLRLHLNAKGSRQIQCNSQSERDATLAALLSYHLASR